MKDAPLKELEKWLKVVIDDLGIHSREGWSNAIGVSQERLSGWLSPNPTDGAISPDKLRSILVLLRERYPQKSEHVLATWASFASEPSETLTRLFQRPMTLHLYINDALMKDLRMAIMGLPADRQEELLEKFLKMTYGTRQEKTG